MHRRSFLQAVPSIAAGIASWRAFAQESRSSRLRIRDLEFWRLEGTRDTDGGLNRQYQAQPIHLYPEHRPKPYRDPQNPKPGRAPISAIYLKLITEEGLQGLYGPIDAEAAIVVDRQLKGFIRGKDPLAGETVWDQMYRSNRHSRASHYLMAISAVDNVIWDLRGRYFNAPVYKLLGGPTRPSAEVYGSCLGFSVEPEKAAAKAVELKKQGFRSQKWFLAYGPGDGMDGLLKNVELVRALREAVGDDVQLMFDAFNSWHLDYAINWAKRVERYFPRWIEEAFPPDKMESFVALRRSTSVPVATGEHLYGRWEAQRYLESGAISVVQSDPEWCGGTSELVKICSIASVHDAQVIPHGHAIHAALHVVSSQSPVTCPLVEFLFSKMSSFYFFDKYPPVPVNAHLELSDRPGFGMELDEGKIEKRTRLTFS